MTTSTDQLDFVDDGQVWDALDTLDRVRTRYAATTGKYTSIGETEQRERARRYLATMDPSIEGQNGSARLWRAAIVLVNGFDIHPEHATEMLIDSFNPRCAPPWSIAELQRAAWRAHRAKEREPRGYLLRRGKTT